MIEMLWDGPKRRRPRVLLAHGAGAGMDSPFMEHIARELAAAKLSVARFEFPYMARRRQTGSRTPPDRAPVLLDCFRQAVSQLGAASELAIGGKSLGGRMATLLADELGVAAVVCLGYPFHPPGRPDKTRTEHLRALATPCLIVQGTRDPFGTQRDVAQYVLSRRIRITWIEDGDHDLSPRRSAGFDRDAARAQVVRAVADFVHARAGGAAAAKVRPRSGGSKAR